MGRVGLAGCAVILIVGSMCPSSSLAGFESLTWDRLPEQLREERMPGFVGASIDLRFFKARGESGELAEHLYQGLESRLGVDLGDEQGVSRLLDRWMTEQAEDLPPGQGPRAQDVAQLFASARQGDLWARILLAWRIEMAGDEALAMDLYRAVLSARDDRPAADASSDRLLWRALMLRTGARLAPQAADADELLVALGWMARSAELGHPAAGVVMHETMRATAALPSPELLEGAQNVSTEMEAAPVAGACPDAIADPDRILAIAAQARAQVAADPERAEAIIAEAYASMDTLGGPLSQRIGLKFGEIPLHLVMMLVAEENGLELTDAPRTPLLNVAIKVTEVPTSWLFAELSQRFGLVARCQGQRLRLVHRANAEALSGKGLIVVDPVPLRVEPASAWSGEAAQGVLHWPNGVSFEGQIVAGRPAGKGRLTFADGWWLRARIVDGTALGEAEYRSPSVSFTGTLKDGLLHGPGDWRDLNQGWVFTGEFREGMFHGHGGQRLPDARLLFDDEGMAFEGMVFWNGPFVASRRHGRGECVARELRYACTFDNDRLTAIGDVSLAAVSGQ